MDNYKTQKLKKFVKLVLDQGEICPFPLSLLFFDVDFDTTKYVNLQTAWNWRLLAFPFHSAGLLLLSRFPPPALVCSAHRAYPRRRVLAVLIVISRLRNLSARIDPGRIWMQLGQVYQASQSPLNKPARKLNQSLPVLSSSHHSATSCASHALARARRLASGTMPFNPVANSVSSKAASRLTARRRMKIGGLCSN